MKTLVLSFVALLLVCAALATTTDSRSGVWTAELDGGRLHVSLFASTNDANAKLFRDHGMQMSFELPMTRFQGFAATDQTRFSLRAPAGTIEFDGHFTGDQGAGHYRFVPNDDFVRELASLGYTSLRDDTLLLFTTTDFSPATVRELRSMGYDISRRDLDEIAVFHITPQTVRDYAAAGYPKLTLRELVNLRVGNVDANYIAAMRELGFTNLSARDLADTAILGVTPAYVRQLRAAGLENLTASELRDLRVGRVDPQMIEALRQAGYGNLTPRQLSEFGIHHVTPEYINELRKAGYDNLSPHQIVEMRIFNITPEFIHEMNNLGVTDLRKMIDMKATGAADILLKKRQR